MSAERSGVSGPPAEALPFATPMGRGGADGATQPGPTAPTVVSGTARPTPQEIRALWAAARGGPGRPEGGLAGSRGRAVGPCRSPDQLGAEGEDGTCRVPAGSLR